MKSFLRQRFARRYALSILATKKARRPRVFRHFFGFKFSCSQAESTPALVVEPVETQRHRASARSRSGRSPSGTMTQTIGQRKELSKP